MSRQPTRHSVDHQVAPRLQPLLTGEPADGPDPSDPGPPIPVRLGEQMIGDLGHPRVDAHVLSAILLRGGNVGAWLQARGVDLDDLEDAFPGSA